MPKLKGNPEGTLTTPQEMFCRHLVNDLKHGNKIRAARAADCKENSASQTAARWLRLAKVQRRLEELRSENLVHHRLTGERILREYERIAFADPNGMYDGKGNLLPVPKMPEDMRRIVAAFDVEDRVDMTTGEPEVYTVKKVRMHDKRGALDALLKWKDMLPAQKRDSVVRGPGKDGALLVSPAIRAVINIQVLPAGFVFPVDVAKEG